MTIKDKFRGTILWKAIADAAGAPYEFKPIRTTHSKINKLIKEHGTVEAVAQMIRIRSWTDDTHLACLHARSIIQSGGFDPEDTAKEMRENALARQGSGGCTREAVANLKNGVSWKESGRTDPETAGGNGPSMKIAPLGLFFHDDIHALYDNCKTASMITHNCPEAFAGARAIAYAVALGVSNELSPDTLIDKILSYIEDPPGKRDGGIKEYGNKLARVKHHLEKNTPPMEALQDIGSGGWIVENVAAALYCFLKSPDKPHVSILRAILCGGDTDTTAAVVGAIHGAYSGTSKIPKKWFERLEQNHELVDLADKLYDAWERD